MRLLNKKDKNGFNFLTNEKLGNGFELFSCGGHTSVAMMLPMMSLLVYHLGQNNDTCTSSAMPGIGLGPPVAIIQKRSNTWQDCRDLCCKNDACVAWTLLKAERICFLRNQLGTHVLESKNQISGVTKGYVLPSPRRKELRFYVGILSAAKNRARVHMLTVPA